MKALRLVLMTVLTTALLCATAYGAGYALMHADDADRPTGAADRAIANHHRCRTLEDLERTVVEDVAVLVDLDERRARVRVRPFEDGRHVLRVAVERAGDERAVGSQRDGGRVLLIRHSLPGRHGLYKHPPSWDTVDNLADRAGLAQLAEHLLCK